MKGLAKLALGFLCLGMHLQTAEAAVDYSLSLEAGYRTDSLIWKEVPPVVPATTLELDLMRKGRWKNVNFANIVAEGQVIFCENLFLRGIMDYGRAILNGDYVARYVDATEQTESLFIKSKAESRDVYDLEIDLGYDFHWCEWGVTPIVGFTFDKQSFHHCGFKLERSLEPDGTTSTGNKLDKFDNSYNARWDGPLMGFDLFWRPCCNLKIFMGTKFHWGRMHGRARSKVNLMLPIPNTPNFQNDEFSERRNHRAHFFGETYSAGFENDFLESWSWGIVSTFRYFLSCHPQTEKIRYTQNGASHVTTRAKPPRIFWYSFAIKGTIEYVF